MGKKNKAKKIAVITVVVLFVAFSLLVAVTHTEGYGIYTRLPDATIVDPEGMDINGGCALDFCNDIPVSNDAAALKGALLVSDDSYVLSGWAVDIRETTNLDGVYLQAGKKVVRCNYGFQRDDIAEVFGSEECRQSGFLVEIPAKMIRRFDGTFVESISFYLLCKDNNEMVGPIVYKIN